MFFKLLIFLLAFEFNSTSYYLVLYDVNVTVYQDPIMEPRGVCFYDTLYSPIKKKIGKYDYYLINLRPGFYWISETEIDTVIESDCFY